LRGSVKCAYGLGLAAEGVKQNAFSVFVFFYYQQIMGLDPALCGVALFMSLCLDAIADPAIGVWSDALRSRLGRRHPFMYAGIVPLAGSFYAVFVPPHGMPVVFTFLREQVTDLGAAITDVPCRMEIDSAIPMSAANPSAADQTPGKPLGIANAVGTCVDTKCTAACGE
jgi:Na+/melibiose symporter-like transporter